ncbi:MAG: DUF4255 domain-containing protein [Dehalococcoidia bacterium]
MLHLVDDALEAYLRGEVPLRSGDVDIVFARPDKDWGAAVTRPTINVFLWDVRRNSGAQEAGMEWMEVDGKRTRRAPQPRVDCRYMITAWAGDPRDEHQLLGAVLAALLRHSEVPEGYLPAALADVRPLPALSVPRVDGSDNADFWTGVGGDMRPSVDLTVAATLDAAVVAEAGPPVLRVVLGAERALEPGTHEVRDGASAPDATGSGDSA